MDDPRPDDLIRRRHRRRAAAGDHGAATSMATTGTKRGKPEVISDLGAHVPVTEAEIRLVAAMLGGAIDRVLRSRSCRWFGMTDIIARDPDILGGRPVFRGTRVPIEVLFENLEDGLTIDEIIESYPSLNKADLIACLQAACASLKSAR